MNRRLIRSMPALLILATLASGCAGWRPLDGAPSLAEVRVQRSQEVIEQFERERSKMQLEAALDRWQQGDTTGCESRLRTLLARDPKNLEARLRLAELAWSEGDLSTATAEYRVALAQAPNREDIEEALTLVLESQ